MGHPIMLRAIAGMTRDEANSIYRIPPNTAVFAYTNPLKNVKKLPDGSTVVVGYTELPKDENKANFKCIGVSVTGVKESSPCRDAKLLFTVCTWGPAVINHLPTIANTCIGQTLYIVATDKNAEEDQMTSPHEDHHKMHGIVTAPPDAGTHARKIVLLNRTDDVYGAHGGLVYIAGDFQ
jgi:hypothetical protein